MTGSSRKVLGARDVGDDDQHRFAELSGDYNEIHLDPIAARRAMGGERVVHGVNSMLWAIDRFSTYSDAGVTGVAVTFRKPVHLREETEVVLLDHNSDGARLWVTHDGVRLVDIRLVLGDMPAPETPDDRTAIGLPRESTQLSIEEMTGLSGTVEVPAGDDLVAEVFPHATSSLGGVVVSQLASISRLVGMVCPGRYSMLSAVDLTINSVGSSSHIHWTVTRADPRVGAVVLELSGGRVEGSVNAFVRPRPTPQPTMGEVAGLIGPGEFTGCRALVVGGSRGLGELTAKLLAVGGADVVVTWLASGEEATRVIAEIRSGGGLASAVQLDVAEPTPPIAELASRGWTPNQLYYFASPPIFARRTGLYDRALFDRFARCYVEGFADAVEACRDVGVDQLTALYPSSVSVEENIEGLTEYAAAKAAGEVAARTLGASQRWLTTVVRRLPRLPTDQTATLMPVPAEDPLMVVPDLVRAMAVASLTGESTSG